MNYNAIKAEVANAIQKNLNTFHVEDKSIHVKDIKFDERNINKQTSWNHIQKVKNRNGTVSVPILADIEIYQNKKLISRDKNLNVGQLPIITKNDTALVKGIEYTVPVQIRRDPGIYTSQATNGIWKTMVNSAKGKNFKVEMDPVSNIQKIEIDGTRIPLLPVLQHFGIQKDNIIKAWGGDKNAKDLYTLNERAGFTATGRKSLNTLYKKLIYGAHPSATEEQMKAALQTYMKEKSEFRPEVNQKTLGAPHKTLSPQALLDISKKLVNSIKTGVGDDTENLIFKHLKTADNMIGERLNLDFKKKLSAGLSRNLKNKTKVKDIIRPGLFTQSLKGFFTNSEIAEPSEQINPLHMINTATKTTIKGEGGITDENTVNLDMKSLHPSYLGFLDPMHTPDGSAGLVNHLAFGAIKDVRGKLSNLFYNKQGKVQYVPVDKIWDANVATPDQYIIKKGKKPTPKTSRIKVTHAGESKVIPASSVDYILTDSTGMFDPATNLVPFLNSDSGNRVSMGAKFGEQSISLVNRETPNVSTIGSSGKEFIEHIGREFAIKSPVKGVVKRIGPDFIEVKSGSKITKVDLRNNMEMNQESYFHDEPVVKVGQKVGKGALLASNNWTDNQGRFLNGINARVSFLPYKGYSIEDGIVVSDSFAKKMASQHMHVEEINTKEGGLNLDKFKLNFRNKYPSEAFQKLDENGVVKKGSKVERGDILIAYAKPVEFSELDKFVGRLAKGFKNKFIDNSAVWNYDFPGEVVDVIHSNNLIKVKIKSIQPLQVTDKLANAHGAKGICLSQDHQIFTFNGWKLISNVTYDDLIATRNKQGLIEFHKPVNLIKEEWNDEVIGWDGQLFNFEATPNHNMLTVENGFEKLEDIYNGRRHFYKDFNYELKDRKNLRVFNIPHISTTYKRGERSNFTSFNLEDFAAFMGLWISEGSLADSHKISISQTKPNGCEEIERVLNKLNINWWRASSNYVFINKSLYYFLKQFGKSNTRFIPKDWLQTWPEYALRILLKNLVLGDGTVRTNINKTHQIHYFTVSKQLAEDVDYLFIILGYNSNITIERRSLTNPKHQDKYIIKTQTNKYFYLGEDKREKQHLGYYKRLYNGFVYCVEVPNHTIFVKKSKRPFWTGNCSQIIPDSQMPQTADGKPLDVIFNPHGMVSRINPGQCFEASLGKITEKTGKRYLIKNFEHPNNWDFVSKELKKNHLSDTETVIDPETNKEIKTWNPAKKQFDHPFVGNMYIRKLVHQTRKKFDARGRGAYSAIDMPGKDPGASHYLGDSASKENPKAIDRLTTYAVLAHGSKDVINDMWQNKGQNRADVWDAIISGAPIPPPKKSTATYKMEALMRAAGVNTERKGRFVVSTPLTDKDTLSMSAGKIEKPNLFLRGKDLMPIKGGMFDPAITGGMKNFDRYNHIDLGTKIPNPITKNAIKILLDIGDTDFENILDGNQSINGKTGSECIDSLLKNIDVEKTIKKLETDKLTAPKTKINTINRKLRYLKALKSNNLEPKDYMISKIPVIPTGFRPILALPNGTIEPAPLNQLYRDVALASKLATDKSFPKKLKNEATHELYNTLSGLQGVTDPTINKQTTTRKLKSALTELAGSGSPKGGFIHSKLLSKTQDYIGSSVIGVNPHLGIDEIGIPYAMAEKIYEPFLLKELKNSGHKISDFAMIKKENPQVIRSILDQIAKDRPIVFNRNPSLHKGSVWGQNPVLIPGKSIQVNPMILKPISGDFDGDFDIDIILIYIENNNLAKLVTKNEKIDNFAENLDNKTDQSVKIGQDKKIIDNKKIRLDNYLKNCYICNNKTFKNYYKGNLKMSSRINVDLGYVEDGNFYCINLKDFPHIDEIIHQKDHRTFYKVPEGIKVLAYDEETNKIILTDVSLFSVHKDREVWIVTTSNKRQIITDDDPRSVYGIDPKDSLELKRFYPKDSMGVMVPYTKSIETMNNIEIKTEFDSSLYKHTNNLSKYKLKNSISLNKKSGYIFGALTGDGWVDIINGTPSIIHLSGIEMDVVNQYKEFINSEIFDSTVEFGHIIGKASYGRSEKWNFGSREFATIVDEFIGHGAKNKHLPPFWFSASRDFKIGLLSGLLDTDGSICITHGKAKPQLQLNISSISLRLLQECQFLLLSLGVSSKISFSKKTQADNDAWILSISSIDIQKIKNELNIAHLKNINALKECSPNADSTAYTRTDLVPLSKDIADYLKFFITRSDKKYASFRDGVNNGYVTRTLARYLIGKKSNKVDFPEPNEWPDFIAIVRNESVAWSPVVEFEKTGKKETGYDLTVPGYETFMSVDGTILSNTVIVSAPISKKSVDQIKTMIPSLNVLDPKNDKLSINYDQEYMAGIALMTEEGRKLNMSFKNLEELQKAYDKNQIRINDMVKVGGKQTSFGRLLMQKALPPEMGYKGQSMITKKEMTNYLMAMVKDGSVSKYTDVINNIKNLGAKYAYDEGFSFSLDDIRPRQDIRTKLLNPNIPAIIGNKKFNVEKATEVAKNTQAKLSKSLISEHNRAFLPAVYGSRTIRPDVMQQIVATPFFVSGIKGPIKTPISKSYSEGLDLLDNFNVSYGSRKAIVDKVNQVSEPGALSKELVATMSGEVITMKDCGTHEGVTIKLDDTFNLQNRALAEDVNGLSRNTILDKKHLQELRKGKTKNILVRSPLTCKAPKGVCALCYGYDSSQQLPKLGSPIGINAAQSIGETGTQSALSSHHLGGTVAAGSFRTGFDQTKFLLHMPQVVKNKATLSNEDGVVVHIKEGINNSKLVFISKNPDPYICFNSLKVKIGDKVQAGDPLDQGPIKIQELVELAPLKNVQKHLVDQLEKSYGDTKILRRNTETIVRGVTQYSKVINPGESPYLEEELVPAHMVDWIKAGKKIDITDVIGWKLKAQTDKYPVGTQITIDIANDLLKKGIKEVNVNANGLVIKNQATNISSIPLAQPDFYKKLSFERIRNSIKEGPISGSYSNLRGNYPEPALIAGVELEDNN